MHAVYALVLLAFTATAVLAQAPVPPDHAAKMARGLDLFKSHVRPVLVDKCLKCHNAERTEGGLDLTDRPLLLKGGELGPAIISGKGKQSLLYQLTARLKEPHMPKTGKPLPENTLTKIVEWIDAGAPYDAPLAKGPAGPPSWTTRQVPATAKQHWAFQPLRPSPAPLAIDAHILAQLQAKGLSLNAPAEKAKLLRRVTLDLTGLPPTLAELTAFLNDSAPDAYARVVDRLLASPHYGERWGRHWLDLVRFAESHGYEHDYDRPNAYHYRDFVIQALNQDLAYDQFIKWQIAGDEYAPEDLLARTATGFLAAGVHSTQITANEVEKHRYDELDDMLSTIGTSMLGLTIGCARCHDHKFDPIPQADYYRLLSTFTKTVRADLDLPTDGAAYRAAKAKYDAEHEPFLTALAQFEREQLPARLAAWEKNRTPPGERWQVVDLLTTKSAGAATFTKQPDGSVLVGGKNPTIETLTFTANVSATHLAALRIEALTHPSLVLNGPGRALNGNFALTDMALTVQRGYDTLAVPIKSARATFEQKGLPIAAAFDQDGTSGWAVDPQFGKDHAAVFDLEPPPGLTGTVKLTIVLKFHNNVGHGMGRPRLSVSSHADKQPATVGDGLPQAFATALAVPAEKRTPAQQSAVLAWYRTLDAEWQKLHRAEQAHAATAPKPALVKALVASEGVQAVKLHTQGDEVLKATHFLRRGDVAQKETEAPQGFLQVLMPAPDAAGRWYTAPPAASKTTQRRRALAEWLTDTQHGAGALTARVIVNRLWQHHLGRGIVATPSDFGSRTELPAHAELLDALAQELLRNGWKLKPLHRAIVLSATYRQSVGADPAKLKADPDNRLFGRRPLRRLEAEAIRDSLLAVGGLLDPKPFGPGTLSENSRRRSVYFTVKRSQLIPTLQIFDAPDALQGIGERSSTTVAPQALFLLNHPQVRACAVGLAQRSGPAPTGDAVRQAYQHALCRPPTPRELADAAAYLAASADKNKALVELCQVLFCLNEFAYVE